VTAETRARDLVCGIDTGGTFTDCVIIDRDGRAVAAKAMSTPENFAEGVFESLSRAAAKIDASVGEILSRTGRFVVGTTVGTNSFLERKGAKVGLITTRGFEDTLAIMRGVGRTTGVSPRESMMLEGSFKPAPIVAKRLIHGVAERVDSEGELLVDVDVNAVRTFADELVAEGVEAIAICFLWAFRNPENEIKARDAIAAAHPKLYIVCSHEVAPKIGEYERFAATVISAYIGPITMRYVDSIASRCRAEGFDLPPLIMQCNGGVMSSELVGRKALVTLNSGPAGGVSASATLAKAIGARNVITADVGGTSFDVGIIRDGEIIQKDKVEIGQYEFYSPAIDVLTIGAGGGSLVKFDAVRGVITVGPQSAGANPGPICYGRGGAIPTLTDAALHVGYVSDVTSLNKQSGRTALDRARSREALEDLGRNLDLDADGVAAGIIRIAESHMADLVQRAVMAAGVDHRDFTLFAYGGAGPIHAAGFARELGVNQIVIPYGDVASVWSAYGVATGDTLHVYEYAHVFGEPFALAPIRAVFRDLVGRADGALREERIDATKVEYQFELGLRYKTQLNEVYIEVPGALELDEAGMADVVRRFEERYASVFGAEAGFREAGIEVVDFRVSARAPTERQPLPEIAVKTSLSEAQRGARKVLFVGSGVNGFVETPIYNGDLVPIDSPVSGPALIELSGTTINVPPDFSVYRDRFGNYALKRTEGASKRVQS
jgi:N-methylhydantoinase A